MEHKLKIGMEVLTTNNTHLWKTGMSGTIVEIYKESNQAKVKVYYGMDARYYTLYRPLDQLIPTIPEINEQKLRKLLQVD